MLTIAELVDGDDGWEIRARYLDADAASNAIGLGKMSEEEIIDYANDNWAAPDDLPDFDFVPVIIEIDV